MGLIHGRDRLCLVQICNEIGKTSCIKIELNTSSSPHLKALLEDDKITKIFHYARFDVAALKCNLKINTNGQKLYEFTDETIEWINNNNFKNGIINLSIQHTCASLIVQENADPDVQKDLD